jgi:organic hydroperoxide reductase OsmC/OhrA
MSEHHASVRWTRTTPDFTYDTYDRGHQVRYGSGIEVPASAAADFKGDPTRVNPEEAFVGALSSCHMLTFLAIAARKHLVVERYEDDAVGTLDKNAEGRLAVTKVVLHPRVTFDPGRAGRARQAARVGPHQLLHRAVGPHRGRRRAARVSDAAITDPSTRSRRVRPTGPRAGSSDPSRAPGRG